MAGELDERVEAGRHRHLGAAVVGRHPEPEHPGVGQAVDEIAGERSVLLDLLRPGPQLTTNTAAMKAVMKPTTMLVTSLACRIDQFL